MRQELRKEQNILVLLNLYIINYILEKKVLNTGKTSEFCNDLYYFNARWYDPNTGRFTTEDPIRDGINWYSYCSNNPLRFVDPTGLYQVWGQSKDYGMTYGIRTQSRAARLMNTASNAIVGVFIPYVGAGAVQKFRSSLDKLTGSTGNSRFSIYKDTDVPSLDGLGTGTDVGKKLAGGIDKLKNTAGNIVRSISIYGVVKQGVNDVRGLIEDKRIDVFTSGLNRGMFKNIETPEEAVDRADKFVSGVNAFYDNDLVDLGISFEDWQSALVDVSNGVDNELYNETISSIEASKKD